MTGEDRKQVPVEGGKGVRMRVLWTVSSYQLGAKANMDEAEARKMLFKPLDIDTDSITFDGETCSNVRFSQESVAVEDYFQGRLGFSKEELGLKHKHLTVITTNCTIPGFKQYVRLPDRSLIIMLDGVLFFFEPLLNR